MQKRKKKSADDVMTAHSNGPSVLIHMCIHICTYGKTHNSIFN